MQEPLLHWEILRIIKTRNHVQSISFAALVDCLFTLYSSNSKHCKQHTAGIATLTSTLVPIRYPRCKLISHLDVVVLSVLNVNDCGSLDAFLNSVLNRHKSRRVTTFFDCALSLRAPSSSRAASRGRGLNDVTRCEMSRYPQLTSKTYFRSFISRSRKDGSAISFQA